MSCGMLFRSFDAAAGDLMPKPETFTLEPQTLNPKPLKPTKEPCSPSPPHSSALKGSARSAIEEAGAPMRFKVNNGLCRALRFRASGFGLRVWGLGFRGWGLGQGLPETKYDSSLTV